MNIIELKKIIRSLEKNPEGNEDLINFYKQKEKELIKKLREDINEKLKELNPILTDYSIVWKDNR